MDKKITAPTQEEEMKNLITGEERYKAISQGEQDLADGLTATTNGDNKEALIKTNMAIRNYGKAIKQISELVSLLMEDSLQNFSTSRDQQEGIIQIDHQLKTVAALLEEEGILTEEKLERIYKEKVMPAYMAHMKKLSEEKNGKKVKNDS